MSQAQRTAYHTTPIYYVNDVPHPGHAYSTVACDALTRARRLAGQRVFFLTGTDEHGQNIERIAREKGVPVKRYCDEIAARFLALWERLDVRYDRFIRTTDEIHRRGVLALWTRLLEARTPAGDTVIYKDTYAGWYCPRCEAFKTEGELKGDDHLCPDHERPCEWTEEENFFFRLSGYADWLRESIESGELLVEPVGRRNEVLAVVRQGLQDFSISRARVKWGIAVPDEPGHVFYVWMDALANYITALGYADRAEEYRVFWERGDERFHMIGKEIIRFHCLYWPAMLRAAGLPVPTRIFAHGWMTKGGRKLSKTTGNTIDTDELIDRFGVDPVRYFFLREGSFGQDWDFTDEAFVKRYNSDLANDLGNLVSRAATMASKYCDGKVPQPAAQPLGAAGDGLELALSDPVRLRGFADGVLRRYEALDFAGALQDLWSAVGELNQRIVARAPWELAKDPTRREELHDFLYRLLEALRLLGVLVSPVMPTASRRIAETLGAASAEPAPAELAFGRLEPGRALGALEPLFPRVDARAKGSEGGGKVEQQASRPEGAKIEIADFAKVQLRVARVVAAERIPKSKKLLKLGVDLGGETRQLVAGIATEYEPEQLVGRLVVVVANLAPAKLMGVESNGMVLAASVDGRPVLLQPDAEVAPGTVVR